MITLALSKGRIFDETLPLLAAAGIEVLDDPETSRKLILATNQAQVRGQFQGFKSSASKDFAYGFKILSLIHI